MVGKLLATMGLICAMGVAVAAPSIAAWPGLAFPVSQAAANEVMGSEAVAHVGEWTNVQGTVSEILTNRGAATSAPP